LVKSSDFDKVFGDLVSAITSPPLESKLKDAEALEYIDLRFANRVIYKFRENFK